MRVSQQSTRTTSDIDIRKRQRPLKERYRQSPEEAWITDWARSVQRIEGDEVHGHLNLGHSSGGAQLDQPYVTGADHQEYGSEWPTGIHRAVGGNHDLPNPGNILSAALTICMDSTIQMIANIMDIELAYLQVKVSAQADVRGTLIVDRDVPVQFQKMTCEIEIRAADQTPPAKLQKLIEAAKYSSVNLQTLRQGVPVKVHSNLQDAPQEKS